MKNLLALTLLLLFAITAKSQIKVWPGGKVSFNTTLTPPGGSDRVLFKGPTNYIQSGFDQTLIRVDAYNEPDDAFPIVINQRNGWVKNYVVSMNGAHNFWVYGKGKVKAKSYGYISDSTLKTQIFTIDSALYKLLQLRGVTYKFKSEISDTIDTLYSGVNAPVYMGLIAQEVSAIVPEVTDTMGNGKMSVDYGSLIGLVIEGIKDLDTKVGRMEYWKKDTLNNIGYKDGNVGIGTESPVSALDIRGSIKISDGTERFGYVLTSDSTGKATWQALAANYWGADGDNIYNTNAGNVGIGTTTPTTKFDVAGGTFIHTEDSLEVIRLQWGDKYDTLTTWNMVSVQPGQVDIIARNNVNSTESEFTAKNDGDLVINTSDDSRYVGVGIYNPSAKLHSYANYDAAIPTKAGYFYATGGSSANYGIHAYAAVSSGNYAAYLQGDAIVTGTMYTPSDEKLKTNIRKMGNNTLAKIKTLGVASYEFNTDMVAKHNFPQGLQIGIMAQDIEKQWPQLVRTDKHQQLDTAKAAAPKFDEFKVVNYNGLIPILVKGIQELDATVDSLKALVAENVILKAENEDLKKDVAGIKDMLTKFGDDLQYCCFNQGTNQHTPTGDNSKLEQNNPNPFSENTTIRYYIAAQSKEAVIRISDLNGTVLNTFKIDAKGAGQILLSGNSLKAGTYIYELIVDGKQIDAKRMVLTY
jgi:hypothetical protein